MAPLRAKREEPVAEYVLGIDVGTTGTKALLVEANTAGRVVARATQEYPLHTPRPGWAEQDPQDWWRATVKATDPGARPAGRTYRSLSSSESVHHFDHSVGLRQFALFGQYEHILQRFKGEHAGSHLEIQTVDDPDERLGIRSF